MNDNKRAPISMLSHMYFLAVNYSELTNIISKLPPDYKVQFNQVIADIESRLHQMQDEVENL